uniref:Corticotropin-releasing factor receptor 2-like n=1 Tax=Phallusia mammillata TaxID=59560 RepID=A0A6F9DA61_9ASCI|nr:corticotropin-releasing factor receptor 2-like [Phallusia mammillata]
MESCKTRLFFLGFTLLCKALLAQEAITAIPSADTEYNSSSTYVESDMNMFEQQEAYYNGRFLDQYRPECYVYAPLIQNSTDYIKALMDLNSEMSMKQACYRTLACDFLTRKANSCRPVIDALGTCFAETPGGAVAIARCPESFNNIRYHTSDNVSRRCLPDGLWEAKSNYSACRPIHEKSLLCDGLDSSLGSPTSSTSNVAALEPTCERHLFRLALMSYVGRGLSLGTLILTFIIFWALRSIRCWRIIIHWNLTGSLILHNFSWILLHVFVSYESMANNTVACRILVTMFNYTQMTNYFWCFVEGLYLHMMVVRAYTYDKFNLTTYMFVGWGVPLPIIGVWMAIKLAYQDTQCWIARPEVEQLSASYFLHIPTLIVLLVNAVILANIVRILITKLRSRATADDRGVDYMKAVKAALFLLPMLGFTYIIFLVNPAPGTAGELIFYYVNTFLQSFQGFFVCVIFCFANGEIQTAVRKAFRSWRHQHPIPCCNSESHKRRFSSMSLSRSINNTQTFRLSHKSQQDSFGSMPNNNKRYQSEISCDTTVTLHCHLAKNGDVLSTPLTSECEQQNAEV